MYRDRGGKDRAGVIAGVVSRTRCEKLYADKIDIVARPELEQVIIALTEKEVITDEQAKQARVATHARTKDGFTMDGVDATIRLTKILIEAQPQ